MIEINTPTEVMKAMYRGFRLRRESRFPKDDVAFLIDAGRRHCQKVSTKTAELLLLNKLIMPVKRVGSIREFGLTAAGCRVIGKPTAAEMGALQYSVRVDTNEPVQN